MKKIIEGVYIDEIIAARMEEDSFKKKLGITDERYEGISKALLEDGWKL
ncbi:hypothetical protein [Clostridium saccharoperbutylacetonicum]